MLFKAVRKLFSHRDESAGYDIERGRDGYMDALREIQAGAAAKRPSDAAREQAQEALSRLDTPRANGRGGLRG